VSRLYCIDTNLFIDAERSDESASSLQAFVSGRTGFMVMSAIVAQELRAGARTKAQVDWLEQHIIGPYERRGRLITPTFWAWKECGRVLSELYGPGELARAPRSFINDVLLALSCRESGVVLVTRNVGDFERIAKVRKFDFVSVWP